MAITYTAGGILSLKVAMLRYTLTISITYLTGRILNNNKWFSALCPQLIIRSSIMSLNKHLYVVAFDIVSDKIRYRCVKILLSYGQRVQKSVFECILNDKQFLEMKSKLDNTINPEIDSIRYYLLCANCEKNISVSGIGLYSYFEDLIIV